MERGGVEASGSGGLGEWTGEAVGAAEPWRGDGEGAVGGRGRVGVGGGDGEGRHYGEWLVDWGGCWRGDGEGAVGGDGRWGGEMQCRSVC